MQTEVNKPSTALFSHDDQGNPVDEWIHEEIMQGVVPPANPGYGKGGITVDKDGSYVFPQDAEESDGDDGDDGEDESN